ncbi:MAG: glycosyltransferase family 4 protein [Cytophagaceae bacterium]|nr:glycosyltransferase family 4 protein [Cytophagaceae bacterium]
MSRPLRILFLTPFGGKTGSEMVLWNLLSHLDRSRFEAAIFCEQPGALRHELPPDIPFFSSPYHGSFTRKIWAKGRHAVGLKVLESFFADLNRAFRPDCWYLNTLQMAPMAQIARNLGVPVVGHVHEISHLLYEHVAAEDLISLIESARLLIGNADAVCDELRLMGAPRVERLYPFVNLAAIQPDPARAIQLRHQLGIADTDFVWLMSGTPIYRKGVDLVPAIARLLPPRVHLVWTGGVKTPSASFYLVQKRLEAEGRNNVHFVGAQTTDYAHYLAATDGFVLTSREEAFGMVNVEAAYLGKPIVAFDAGGNREILTEGMGILVENGNVPALVDAMQRVMNKQYSFKPEVARARAQEFDVATLVSEWHRIMGNF